jgi:hypothetical protein
MTPAPWPGRSAGLSWRRGTYGIATDTEVQAAVTRLETTGILTRRKPYPRQLRNTVVERGRPITGHQTSPQSA